MCNEEFEKETCIREHHVQVMQCNSGHSHCWLRQQQTEQRLWQLSSWDDCTHKQYHVQLQAQMDSYTGIYSTVIQSSVTSVVQYITAHALIGN